MYYVELIDFISFCLYCLSNVSGGWYCSYYLIVVFCQDMSCSKMGQMKVFMFVDIYNMIVILFYVVCFFMVLVFGGSEGGMKCVIVCFFDIMIGILYREIVLRIFFQSVDCMEGFGWFCFGLVWLFFDNDV